MYVIQEEINLLELYAKRAEITLARNEQTRKQQRILAQVTSIVQVSDVSACRYYIIGDIWS